MIMKIITELITPFNKKEIDYVSFNKFIETNNNDYILIFCLESTICCGYNIIDFVCAFRTNRRDTGFDE